MVKHEIFELTSWGKCISHTHWWSLKHPVPSDVVDHECPCSSAVVGAGDSPEALLSCCVPNLKLDLLAANLNYSCTKLHTDCMGAVRHDWGEEVRLQWIKLDSSCQLVSLLPFRMLYILQLYHLLKNHHFTKLWTENKNKKQKQKNVFSIKGTV